MKLQLLAIYLGASEIQLASSALLRSTRISEQELVDALTELDAPLGPLKIHCCKLSGRFALMSQDGAATRLALIPTDGFEAHDPFSFAEACDAFQQPEAGRAFLRELLCNLLLTVEPAIDPAQTFVTLICPLAMPLRFRSALWEVLEELGFRWIRLIYPPEASLLWSGVSQCAEWLAARLETAAGPRTTAARVERTDEGYRLQLSADPPRMELPAFSWDAPVRDCLRGALLMAAGPVLLRKTVRISRAWRFSLSFDGETAETLRPQELGAARPGTRLDFIPFVLDPSEHDPALALYAGLHADLSLQSMAFCGIQRVNKYRLAENSKQLIGFVELFEELGVRWGYQFPGSGEIQAESLPQRLFGG